jgi:digeranylgeranylglycerophospholipid reductase
MDLRAKYDIIVVGAGPAGSMAADAAAKQGVSVLLLEKDREIGIPVRCAEAVGKDGIEKILQQEIDPQWIATTIRRFQFVAPDGTVIFPKVNMTGYVLNRRMFDHALAVRAAKSGTRVICGAYVKNICKEDGFVSGVICEINHQEFQITAKVVIAADGIETRLARWAGIDTTIAMKDMETCCQMTLAGLPVEDDICIFYFSQKIFPGGYGWLFPKGNGTANVGMGISGSLTAGQSVCHRLQKFIQDKFPDASILTRTMGGVPCANRLAKLCSDGFLVAGDAAHQSNPLTGGGITTAMAAGKLAGQIAARAVKQNTNSIKFLSTYEREWDKIAGKSHKKYYKLKEAINKLTDTQLNATAHILQEIPPEKHTLTKIFQTALRNKPSLLLDIVKVLSPFS